MSAVAERTRSAPLGLREAARTFTTFDTARWLFGMLCVAVAVRVLLGDWRWRDAVVGVVLVALQPFTEWVIQRRS